MSEYNYNLLLDYLSRKNSGNYSNFKKYVINLNYDLTEEFILNKYEDSKKSYDPKEELQNEKNKFVKNVRNMLSRLGHVEFDFNGSNSKFMVAPAVICLLPNSFKGVLCGYRTEDFLVELEKYCNINNIYMTRCNDNYEAPDAIFIDFINEDNLEIFKLYLSEQENIYIKNLKIIKNFSKIVLTNVPQVETIIKSIENNAFLPSNDICNNDEGKWNFFDIGNLKCQNLQFGFGKNYNDWVVWEYKKNNYTHLYYIKYDNKYYKIDKKYGMLVNIYQNEKKISINSLPLPELIDRALCLLSGYNCFLNNNQKQYRNIDKDIVELLNKVTGLEIEYEK